jgi:glycosyltransferase involved in cell wall biosynthesis
MASGRNSRRSRHPGSVSEKTMSVPKISIVTPSYNQGRFLREALDSVRRQNYPNVEHLVIDGGSTDGTLEILNEISSDAQWRHLRWISEPDRGQSDALNKGFRLATGELVGWLNSDDRYRPGCFRRIVESSANAPESDVLYGDYTFIDEQGRLLEIRREIEFSKFILLYHKVLFIPTTSTFFRRRVFDHNQFVDERFHYAMDFEYFVRLMIKGYRFRHVPGLLADFRWHRDSKSSRAPQKQRAEQNAVVNSVSGLLSRFPPGPVRNLVLFGTRQVAGALRYSEKLLRGYYAEQFLRSDVHD